MKLSSEQIQTALFKASTVVFEQIAFMEVQNIEKIMQLPEFRGNCFYSKISIMEPFNGELGLMIDAYTFEALLHNVEEVDLKTTNIHLYLDYINEYLNTIAGNFMEFLLSDEQPYQIGLPEASINPDIYKTKACCKEYYAVTIENKNIYFIFLPDE